MPENIHKKNYHEVRNVHTFEEKKRNSVECIDIHMFHVAAKKREKTTTMPTTWWYKHGMRTRVRERSLETMAKN